MSGLGQKRTCAVHKAMSALCQKRTSNKPVKCPQIVLGAPIACCPEYEAGVAAVV